METLLLKGLVLSLVLAPQQNAQVPGDTRIADAVERELDLDPQVNGNVLDVEVTSGIVTLEGVTSNRLERERAARIARTVRGVRSVVDRVQVVSVPAPDDASLRADVQGALLNDPAADSYEVEVTVDQGRVTLHGTVDSWSERELCGKVAMAVDGVTELDNELQVSVPDQRLDTEIQAEVQEALRWDVMVDHRPILVEVQDGVVKLRGHVGSAAEKRRARNKAFVLGTQDVDVSGLDVEAWADDADRREPGAPAPAASEVEDAIESAWAVDPRVWSFEVEASVALGVATLRGEVDNLMARRAAEQDARHTVGVYDVHNLIKVRPQGGRSDAQIADDVRAALMRDPYVERYEVEVAVHDGRVVLSGAVDNHVERVQADAVTSRVEGVTTVVNRLDVADGPQAYDPFVDPWGRIALPWIAPLPYAVALKSDLRIAEEIESEFFWSPFVDGDQVDVRVRDGVATLTGTVDSWSERAAARENAFEGGAVSVRNRLAIEGEGSRPADDSSEGSSSGQ